MLYIFSPFWDGFALGALAITFILPIVGYFIIGNIYKDAEPRRKMPPNERPLSIREYMEKYEEEAYYR